VESAWRMGENVKFEAKPGAPGVEGRCKESRKLWLVQHADIGSDSGMTGDILSLKYSKF
jgi:hypothetical protein